MGTNMTEKVRENQHDTQSENVWSNSASHFNMKYVRCMNADTEMKNGQSFIINFLLFITGQT